MAEISQETDEERSERYLNDCIWTSPSRKGGIPCIGGTRLPADFAANYLWDFGTEGGLAELRGGWDYVTDRQWLIACWYVATHGRGEWAKWRTRWKDWAERAGLTLWTEGTLPPWPPENPEPKRSRRRPAPVEGDAEEGQQL